MDLLARREHCQSELQQKLSKRFPEAEEILEVIMQLAKENLQSDRRFIEAYISSRARKGFGPERIRLELQGKQLSEEWVEDELAAFSGWKEKLQQLLEKRFAGEFAADAKTRAKQIRFLLYRGFPQDLIRELSREHEV